MKAISYDRYGDAGVLQLNQVALPEPRRREVRVLVHAASVNPKDVLVRKGKFKIITGGRFPQIPGYDLAGVVDRIGEDVESFQLGDPVYGMIQRWSGGAYAEYAVVPQSQLASKPSTLSMTEAAAMPLVTLTALQALRELARVGPGDRVLLNGASGGVGTMAIQLAVKLGAQVTAVCSAANRELVVSLGAHRVIAYDETPLAQLNKRYDAVFDIFGSAPYPMAERWLDEGGRYVTAIPTVRTLAWDVMSRLSLQPARLVVVKSRRRDLETIARWVEDGSVRPVIDRVFPLAQAADAHRLVETKRARGKVVMQIRQSATLHPK